MATEQLGVYLDYSKNRITDETIQLLLGLAEESRLVSADRSASSRPAHQRDRRPSRLACGANEREQGQSIVVDGENVVPEVHAVLDKMALPFVTTCAVASGKAIPANAFATSSTSGSAVPTWGR